MFKNDRLLHLSTPMNRMKQLLFGSLCLMLGANLFGAGKQLTGQHAPATTPALTPADAQKKFVVPEGFEVRLFAAEPDVINPVAMTWDERGRLWVVELYEYPLGAADGQKPRDRIKILEDTDNDGRADKVTIFAEGFNLATGILIGDGGVYVGQAPDLLFLQDTNGDDKADKRTSVLTGFGLHDRHELLNGFTWGPDGWLYMTHGVFTASKVKIPEATTPGVDMNAAVARFNPRNKKFEIFADGTSNPWGVDFDKYGNAFVSACVIDHLFHMAPGGIYQRQGGVPGNPYAYELLPSIVDHKHHMAAYCGICIYEGDNFPAEYRGRVFMGNIHQNAINHDKLTPNGSSFKATAEKDFVTTSDGWFMPISQQVGPDGALWIGDWYDKYPCYQNAQADPEGVDRTYGRIWRVVHVGKEAGKKMGSRRDTNMNLRTADGIVLIKMVEDKNIWHRRMAQRLLSERQDKNTVVFLSTLMIADAPVESRLTALWTLYSAQLLEPRALLTILNDREPAMRAWAARIIGEYRTTNPKIFERLHDLASDESPIVRLAMAVALRQYASGSLTIDTLSEYEDVPTGEIFTTLIKSSADAKDPLIPFMIWMAGEPRVAKDPAQGLKWLAEKGSTALPLTAILARKAMRRICDTGEVEKMNKAAEFLGAVAGNEQLALAALEGLIEGQKAKALRPSIPTQELFTKLAANPSAPVKERTQQLGAIWGDVSAIEQTLAVVNDSKATPEERIKAIRSAQQFKNEAAGAAVLKLVVSDAPEALIIEGLRSLSVLGSEAAGVQIVKNWQKFSPNSRRAAVDALASRPQWVRALIDALEDNIISPQEISANVARSLTSSKNTNFASRATRLLGRFRDADADKLKIIAEKRKVVLAGEPDLKRGQAAAQKACFVCHKLHGEGAEVGPDLTGVGRSTLDALLANLIDPNQIIGKGYENVIVETKDERIVSGRLIENSDSQVKLLTVGPKEEVVAKSDIASMKVSELSVMPEGLEQMPDDELRDLVWYILAPPQEGPLTPEKRKALSGQP